MKKAIYLIAIMLIAVVSVSAQESRKPEANKKPTAEQIAKFKAERLRKELLLGNDQYDKVYKSCLKQAKEQIKRMEQIAKERKQMNEEMKDILNEAQYERFEKMQHRPMHHNFRGGNRNAYMRKGAMRRANHDGKLKPSPENGFRSRPMRGVPMKVNEESYGDPKRNKNMYMEPKQDIKAEGEK